MIIVVNEEVEENANFGDEYFLFFLGEISDLIV
jgi:hypothetical protein